MTTDRDLDQDDQNVCRVCGEGSVKLITVHNGPESSDIQLYECDSCGSEYADHELAKKNIQQLTILKSHKR